MVVAIVVANMALGVGTLAWVVQRTERSRFRYRMWRVRDRVVGAVLSEEIESHAAVRQWLDRAEVLIAATKHLTPFQFVMASRTMRRGGWKPNPSLTETAPEPVQKMLCDASTEVRKAYARVFALGSPSGWLVLLLVAVSSPVLFLLQQRRHYKKCDEPPLDSVAKWSSRRYGSPADVFRPLVRPNNGKKRLTDAAYV